MSIAAPERMAPRGVRVAIAVGAVAMIAASTAWAGPIRSFDRAWGEDQERRHGWYEEDGEAPYGFLAPHGFFQPHYSMPHYGVSRFEFHDYWDSDRSWDGYRGYDPDCDPPVATPEPTTLLLLGGLLAGVGAATRRAKRAEGEIPGRKVEEG